MAPVEMEKTRFSITTSGFVFPSAFAFTLPLEREILHPVRIDQIPPSCAHKALVSLESVKQKAGKDMKSI
jgi:hypothetical protein